MTTKISNYQEKAYAYIVQNHYDEAIKIYEQAIKIEPDIKSNYWYLGLALMLQGQETEAQMTWMLAISEIPDDEIEKCTRELTDVLKNEAQRQEKLGDISRAWLICQHIREIDSKDINNLLKLIQLSIKQQTIEDDTLDTWEVIELLKLENHLDLGLLAEVLKDFLEYIPLHPSNLKFVEACLHNWEYPQSLFWIILPAAMRIGHTLKHPQLAAKILDLYYGLDQGNIECLRHLATFYQDSGNFSEGIAQAKLCYSLSQTIQDKIFATHLVLRGLMTAGGYWEEVEHNCKILETLLQELIDAQPIPVDEIRTLRLLTPSFAIPHIKDTPERFRKIHNQVAKIFQNNIQAATKVNSYSFKHENNSLLNFNKPTKKLKIGYLSYAFRQHSVGWLARWLIKYHNRENFEINTYFINYKLVDDWLQEWYVSESCKAHKLGMNGLEIAQKIREDEIDILIDLDSITLDISSEIMSLKPAPIQVTWLGWDASGIPAIDYFIADPYVLPDSAQDYYQEKIWRLPQTYIAVDGFEVNTPTLRRNELNISNDAVVFLSTQRGYKRNLQTAKLQMKIVKEVPNSYFLIKGGSEKESIKRFFHEIAEEEGVDCSRLKFLPQVALEATHRANLGIADVVLDTYPYNGATTTLETLWMCVPLVTRVGEQFAARNSYTMMKNAGITEGIAWTDEEYVEWGVRLGKDINLRQEVSWKLRQSRKTAPLWNAKQFTLEMEKAYEQMWNIYVQS